MSKANKEDSNALKDRLNPEVLARLTTKKNNLRKRQAEAEEQLRVKKQMERKKREANKSFAELFQESELDWKKFK